MENLLEFHILSNIFLALLVGYVIGSIPTAVWIGKQFYGVDVRNEGSMNAGATNTFRVLGRNAGSLVLGLDILKGFVAVYLAYYIHGSEYYGEHRILFQILNGIAAVVGHIYPVFAGFKGGKGVATLLGMVLCIHPEAALCSLVVFLLVFLPTGYVSVGSMSAALSFPIFLLVKLFGPTSDYLIVFGFLMFILTVYTHRKNIKRLLDGNENKMKPFGKKSN